MAEYIYIYAHIYLHTSGLANNCMIPTPKQHRYQVYGIYIITYIYIRIYIYGIYIISMYIRPRPATPPPFPTSWSWSSLATMLHAPHYGMGRCYRGIMLIVYRSWLARMCTGDLDSSTLATIKLLDGQYYLVI